MAFRNKKKDIAEKLLDVDAAMSGTLTFRDPVNLRINGKFEGTLQTKGSLTIGETANISADITGDNIVIAGKVKGKIQANVKLALLSSAKVEGEIHPAKLSIEEGAVFEGTCRMLQNYLNAEELAEYLKVEPSSIMEWVNSGKIPARKEGGDWIFERKSIDDWVIAGKIK